MAVGSAKKNSREWKNKQRNVTCQSECPHAMFSKWPTAIGVYLFIASDLYLFPVHVQTQTHTHTNILPGTLFKTTHIQCVHIHTTIYTSCACLKIAKSPTTTQSPVVFRENPRSSVDVFWIKIFNDLCLRKYEELFSRVNDKHYNVYNRLRLWRMRETALHWTRSMSSTYLFCFIQIMV